MNGYIISRKCCDYLFRAIFVYLIVIYQKIISPYKGYSCAYHYKNGGQTCSEYVKQIIKRKGLVSGWREIRCRFRACKGASININDRLQSNETGVLDCSPDGCVPDGCFDGAGSGGPVVIVIPIGILILLLIFGSVTWYKGPIVDSIEIRLVEGQQEVIEKGVAGLIGGKNPDYQIIFTVNGKAVSTNVLNNSSAKTRLKLWPEEAFGIEDVEKFEIVNKQVLGVEVLETIENVTENGSGLTYEYRIDESLASF